MKIDMDTAQCAFHEAGHAIMYFMQGIEFADVSIVADTKSSGRINLPKNLEFKFYSVKLPEFGRDIRELTLMIDLSGFAAEKILFNGQDPPGDYAKIDVFTCRNIMREMTEDEYTPYIGWIFQQTLTYIRQEWRNLEIIACRLAEMKTIDYMSIATLETEDKVTLFEHFMSIGMRTGSLMMRRADHDPSSLSEHIRDFLRVTKK